MPAAVSEHIKDLYSKFYGNARESEWRRLGAMDKVANLTTLASQVPHSSVLEVGAGDGAILRRLDQVGFGEELYGLEISESGVDEIRKKAIPRLAEVQIFDGYRIPYADKRFDLVVLSHVVEHVEHPRMLLYESARVARHVFVEVPLEDHARMAKDFVLDFVGHVNFYSPVTIRKLVQSCGFEVLEQRVIHGSKAGYVFQKGTRGALNYYIKEGLLRVAPRLATWFFTFNSALLCKPK